MHYFKNHEVAVIFDGYPPEVRQLLMTLRDLIFNTAAKIPLLGPLDETLKWGEPAYRASQSKLGTTIRIGWNPTKPSQFALYFNCKTQLVDTFRTLYPELRFEGNRAIYFSACDELPAQVLSMCIEAALTYRRRK